MSHFGIHGVVSDNNSTTANIAESTTFTGEWDDVLSFASISVIGSAANGMTLIADFSTDASTISRSINLSSGANGNVGIHSLIPIARYFRIRLVNNFAGTLTSVDVQTIYHTVGRIAQPTSRLGQELTEFSDALNTRTVIANVSGINAFVTDSHALLTTVPTESKTIFGELLVGQTEPLILVDFVYTINSGLVTPQPNQNGTITQADSMATLATGAAANSSARLISNDVIRYRNGFMEIRTLTISAGSSTAENITITLNGDAVSVPVTNSADATVTANEIAVHNYSDVGEGWTTRAVGNTVIFISWSTGSKAGIYSLSGASTAAGTFAQTVAGITATETWIPQTSWNGRDKFDGTGLSATTLDPTKGNVFQITYQWLGFGAINFYIEDPDDGEYHLVHHIDYANANTIPSFSNPSLPMMAEVINTSNTSNIVLKSASWGGFVDGGIQLLGPRVGVNAFVSLGASSTEAPIMTIRNKDVYQGRPNQVYAKILLASVAVEHSKPVQIIFYKNTTLVGASFTSLNVETSVLELDTSATSFSGGTKLFAISLGKAGNSIFSLLEDKLAGLIPPGGHITATIKPSSGQQAEAEASLNIVELF